MLKASTGLRTKLLDTGSLKSILDGGVINIYSGPVPATADAALDPSNTRLCTVTVGSGATGLSFDDAAADGVLAKPALTVLSGVDAASSTASFYRHVAAGDDGTASTAQARLQGGIATFGAELNLTSTALVSGATQTIDFYSVAVPTL